ncbi:DUF4221 domain-containing protein [Algoriphagus sp. AGSA1]|uniref:DUF4221 family protein n=1 Tax=Algoriphagus sp. AGSA1 TaxID=2907213 RepID=UPI001F356AF9|nr:DUF4221 family protein [Algoriphagus sp. AGSA1]MCE7055935.1 DUF4221 domain-containing protein [Algoriphagus sp. AGSA1]
MRKLLTISVLALLSACKEKPGSEVVSTIEEPKNILENLTYTVDTLMVDTGNEILDFSLGYSTSPSPDGRFFYFFKNLKMQKIDLDHLTLINSFSLEKDGPNSPGHTFGFYALSGGNFFFPTLHRPSIITDQGLKIKAWNLDREELAEGFPVEPFSLGNRVILDPKRLNLYSLPMNIETRDYYFAVIDSLENRKKMVELTEFKWANKYLIRSDAEQKGEFLHLQQFNELVLISCTVGNGTYIYNPSLDSLFYREFSHEIVPLEKTGEVKNKVGSRAEFEDELKKLKHQIDYWSFLWDQKSKRYFRFASRAIRFDEGGWAKEFELFLMAYSKDLELIGETRLKGLSRTPFGAFFKDGKLYSYVNIEDELGFAVFTFDF